MRVIMQNGMVYDDIASVVPKDNGKQLSLYKSGGTYLKQVHVKKVSTIVRR